MEKAGVLVYFTINYRTQPGHDVYVLGNCLELGNWDLSKGLKLTWNDKHDWKGSTILGCDASKHIEYKYVVYDAKTNKPNWEEGPNRQIQLFQHDLTKESINLDEVWEHRRVIIRIKYDCADNQQLLISGNMNALGYWRRGVPMTKVSKTDPIQKKKTTFWEKQIAIRYDRTQFNYRFAVEDLNTKAQIWEREPDRLCNLLNLSKTMAEGENKEIDVNKKDCIAFYRKHNTFIKVDVNFVANFYFNKITEKIYIGPYPQSEENVAEIQKEGIDSILCLQTTEDMSHRAIKWDNMLKIHEQHKITAINYQILDMNPADMELKAFEAACHLKYLCDNHKKTYVHCTAGIGRAPQTVIAYLAFFEGYTIDDAIKLVKTQRPITYANRDCMLRAYANNKHRKREE